MKFTRSAAFIGLMLLPAAAAFAQPSVVTGGVLNGASFAKDSSGHGTAVAPGSLVSIFGTGLGSSQADADSVPFSITLGGVGVTFGGFSAPIRDVIPASDMVNAQMPFEVLSAGQTSTSVNVVVSFNGMSAPVSVPIVPQAPGVFTYPPGVGNAIMVDVTPGSKNAGAIAAPAGAIPGLTTNPIPPGDFAYFYATGLGVMNPSVTDGTAGASGVTYNVVNMPTILIGGTIKVTPLFAGQAPGFPGVYQVNLQIPANAPAGNAVTLQMISADGTITSPTTATIAIQ